MIDSRLHIHQLPHHDYLHSAHCRRPVSSAAQSLPWGLSRCSSVESGNGVWVIKLGSYISSYQALKCKVPIRKAKGPSSDRGPVTKGECPHHVSSSMWSVLSDCQIIQRPWACHGKFTILLGNEFITQDNAFADFCLHLCSRRGNLRINTVCPWSICFIIPGDFKPFRENKWFCLMSKAKVR